MNKDDDVALINLADMYVYFSKRDHAYVHVMNDPRAIEVDEREVKPRSLWEFGSINPELLWGLKGLGPFGVASIHYWRNHIDFDYFDIGANIGITTIAQSIFYKKCGKQNKKCGKQNNVYGFEPGHCFDLFERSVGINNISDMTFCNQAAVTDKTGRVIFHEPIGNSASSSLLQESVTRPGINETRTGSVQGVSIDDFIKTVRPARGLIIKIDTEGADFKVLDGMRQTMTDRLCVIQIEYFPGPMETYTNPVARLLELSSDYHLLYGEDHCIRRIDNSSEADLATFTDKIKQKASPAADVLLIAKKLPGAMELRDRLIEG